LLTPTQQTAGGEKENRHDEELLPAGAVEAYRTVPHTQQQLILCTQF
jgi:hypothetical protein